MVEEGAVLVAGSLRGRAVDVAPDGFAHPVYRSGLALAVPVQVVTEPQGKKKTLRELVPAASEETTVPITPILDPDPIAPTPEPIEDPNVPLDPPAREPETPGIGPDVNDPPRIPDDPTDPVNPADPPIDDPIVDPDLYPPGEPGEVTT
jgi:hypothetical protein